MMRTMVQRGLLLPSAFWLAACSSQPDVKVADRTAAGVAIPQTGLASYYADRYHNKKTASGERYNNSASTAAHMTLPSVPW